MSNSKDIEVDLISKYLTVILDIMPESMMFLGAVLVFVQLVAGTLVNDYTTPTVTSVSVSAQPNALTSVLALLVEEKSLRHKLEQEMETIKSELNLMKHQNGIANNNTDALSKNQIESLVQTTNSLKDDVVQTNQTMQLLEEKVRNLENENSHMKQQIIELQRQTSVNTTMTSGSTDSTAMAMRNSESFTANEAIVTNGVIRFRIIIFQEGNGYSTHSGVFTCTYPGFYLFSITVLSRDRCKGVSLAVDGYDKTFTYPTCNDVPGVESASSTLIIRLHAGQRVWAHTSSSHIDHASSFSGVLLLNSV